MDIEVFRGWNVKRTKVFKGTITYRYEIGYTNVPGTKVILEYTHGKVTPMSVKAHSSVLKDERISRNLTHICKHKVTLPTTCDGEWYELQEGRE